MYNALLYEPYHRASCTKLSGSIKGKLFATSFLCSNGAMRTSREKNDQRDTVSPCAPVHSPQIQPPHVQSIGDDESLQYQTFTTFFFLVYVVITQHQCRVTERFPVFLKKACRISPVVCLLQVVFMLFYLRMLCLK